MRKPISGTQLAVYEILCRAASEGRQCPTNLVMADMIHAGEMDLVAASLLKLSVKGYIEVTRANRCRIVKIVDTGQSTLEAPVRESKRKRSEKHAERNNGSNKAIQIERALIRQAHTEDVLNRMVKRDPCFSCGVPYDKHDEFGCRRWRGTV